MKKKLASSILLSMILAVILFHLAILTKIIPYTIAWGGRLRNDQEMIVFESVSIAINLFLGVVVLMHAGMIKFVFRPVVIRFILWFYLVVFALNTIGNFFAETNLEKFFSILTLIFALLIGRILRSK